MNNIPRTYTLLLAVGLALSVPACAPNVDVRGNLPHADQLAQIKVGKTTRDEVQSLLGTPSAVTPFGDETWHYISARTESMAFFEPEVKERKVITVVFDRGGIVRELNTKGIDDGRNLRTVSRETPTAGKEMNVLQQLLGNVGRFSKDPAGK